MCLRLIDRIRIGRIRIRGVVVGRGVVRVGERVAYEDTTDKGGTEAATAMKPAPVMEASSMKMSGAPVESTPAPPMGSATPASACVDRSGEGKG